MGRDKYIPALIDEIIGNFPNSRIVEVEKTVHDFVLDAKRLQPLGIILNELLTNIMKYAFFGRNNGLISVMAKNADGHATVSVQDDGVGMPESVSFENSTGFGFQLAQALTQQLDGTIRIERVNGTRVVLGFPLQQADLHPPASLLLCRSSLFIGSHSGVGQSLLDWSRFDRGRSIGLLFNFYPHNSSKGFDFLVYLGRFCLKGGELLCDLGQRVGFGHSCSFGKRYDDYEI